MYDRILVPVDGSRFSEEVIACARGLAAAHGSAVVLLRVTEREADEAEARRQVEQLAAAHNATGLCVTAHGDVAEAILEQAHRVPGTLVAMTSHGRSGLMEAMLGSVALRLVRAAGGAPVLLYRPTGRSADGAPVQIRRVVLPLDGTELSEAIAPQAAELARSIGASLNVVAVVNPGRGAGGEVPDTAALKGLESGYVRASARELQARHGMPVNWEVLHGDPVEAISAYVAGQHDTLLAMVTRARPALQATLLGSVTSGCLQKAGVPVLVRVP